VYISVEKRAPCGFKCKHVVLIEFRFKFFDGGCFTWDSVQPFNRHTFRGVFDEGNAGLDDGWDLGALPSNRKA
jgi:hypothetical protein